MKQYIHSKFETPAVIIVLKVYMNADGTQQGADVRIFNKETKSNSLWSSSVSLQAAQTSFNGIVREYLIG